MTPPIDAPRPGEPTPLLVRKSKDDQIEYWRDQYLAAESRATTAERELTKEPGTRSEVITVLRDQLAAAESRATTVEQERDEYKRELIKTLEADQFKPDPKVLEAQRDEAWERLRKLDMIGDELAAAERERDSWHRLRDDAHDEVARVSDERDENYRLKMEAIRRSNDLREQLTAVEADRDEAQESERKWCKAATFVPEYVDGLRQALWDCAKWAGADLDGDATPFAMVSSLESFAVDAVKEMRECYDESLDAGNLAMGAGSIMTQRALVAEKKVVQLRNMLGLTNPEMP